MTSTIDERDEHMEAVQLPMSTTKLVYLRHITSSYQQLQSSPTTSNLLLLHSSRYPHTITTKMPPANDDGSLKTLLTLSQRQELLNLLTAASATLRAHILQTFPVQPSEKTSILKEATLSSFDTWRTSALDRFREAIEQSPASSNKASNLFSRPQTEDPQKPSPPIAALPEDTKKKILAALLLILLSLHTYDSRSRILLLDITRYLSLPLSTLISLESTTAIGLLEAAQDLDSSSIKSKESNTNKWGIGLATVAGAALIGVTGGLAAPLVAAGITSVMGGLGLGATAMATYLGAAASSSAFVGTLFGAYGARRSNEIAGRYAAEVEDFRLERLGGEEGERRMRIAIGVTGWIEEDVEKEVRAPWVAFNGEAVAGYGLRWETGVLEDLGKGAGNVLGDYATGWVKGQIIKRRALTPIFQGEGRINGYQNDICDPKRSTLANGPPQSRQSRRQSLRQRHAHVP